jgi:hypothetical protein
MTVVFSVIFPGNLIYFKSFIKSLECQIYKNFKLILINDGVIDIDSYFIDVNLDYEAFLVKDLSPFEIRILGMKLVSDLNPEFIIFADTDDTFSPNRVEALVQGLKFHPFVCNDIDLMNDEGHLIKKSVWGNRLKDNFEFDIHFIKDKNIIGLGNAGIQNKYLNKILNKIEGLKEGNDWLFFSAAEESLQAVFLKHCSTNYRQHNNNVLGKKAINIDDLVKLIEGRIKHYTLLKIIKFKCYDLTNEINLNHNLLQYVLNEPIKIQKKLKKINLLESNLFWWEEPNYIN